MIDEPLSVEINRILAQAAMLDGDEAELTIEKLIRILGLRQVKTQFLRDRYGVELARDLQPDERRAYYDQMLQLIMAFRDQENGTAH